MASKKAKKSKSKSRARTKTARKSKHDRRKLRTQFMVDFVNQFIRQGSPDRLLPGPNETKDWLWPTGNPTTQQIIDDYLSALNVLLTVGHALGAAPAVPVGSLGASIVPFLAAKGWPATTPVPPDWADEQPTVHLVEIAVISDWLLAAINAFKPPSAAGGGGSHWPPH